MLKEIIIYCLENMSKRTINCIKSKLFNIKVDITFWRLLNQHFRMFYSIVCMYLKDYDKSF